MKTKVIRIRIDSETETRLKNVAASEGKSVSETIRSLIMQSLESSSKHVATGSGIDPKMIRYQVETAIKNMHGSSPGIDPKIIRYQVETLAKIDSILAAMTLDRPGGEGKIRDWTKDANAKATKTLQELQVEEIGSAPVAPKRNFPKVGEKQKEETAKGDFDFQSLPQI